MKNRHTSVAAGLLCALTAIYLLLKVFFSLDFTDEMQYYGQIQQILFSGKLFSGDLFFQQATYLIFYPIFKAFEFFSPQLDYFIVFGRVLYLILVLLTVSVFLRMMKNNEVERSLILIACIFLLVVLTYRIFGISYNTVSYCFVVIILSLWFDRGRTQNRLLPSFFGALLTIVYPPVGIALIALLCAGLAIRRDYIESLRFGLAAVACFGGVVFLSVTLGMLDFQDVLTSIKFSRNFGAVGSVPMFGKSGIGMLGFITAILVANLLFAGYAPEWLERVVEDGRTKYAVCLGLLCLILLCAVHSQYWKLAPIIIFLGLVYYVLLSHLKGKKHEEFVAFMNIGAALGASYSLASGDGFYQLPFGLSLLMPFMLSAASDRTMTYERTAPTDGWRYLTSCAPRAIGLVSCLVLVTVSLAHPYRESYIYRLGSSIREVPAFKGIYTSREKKSLVKSFIEMSSELKIKIDDSMLVVGPNPWMYFVTQSTPVTPMFYMHYSGREEAYDFIEKKLEGVRPDWVIYTGADFDYSGVEYTGQRNRNMSQFLRNIVSRDYECNIRFFDDDLLRAYAPKPIYALANPIEICQKNHVSAL